MTEGELDLLRESCSFPPNLRTRLLEANETIPSTHLGEERLGKTLLGVGGYPNNIKRWKKKFFFISGDDWEFSLGISKDIRVPRVLRSWGAPKNGGFFTIKEVLKSKSFHRSFRVATKSIASNEGNNGEDIPTLKAASVAGDKGESRHSRDDPPEIRSTSAAKGINISEKCPWGKAPNITITKKDKLTSNARGKGTTSPSKEKKKSPAKAKTSSSKAVIVVVISAGTSANTGAILGPALPF
ncbi:hypothetical protein Acr_00g0045130 [Actinidia rufa]|uniref:Uncharacterized protein n=1 Tax=Actinidia rufa TaxID=165716 RepID=A0A7J0DKX2_9ERIC|nr:hypothetical protein Acr_00g0045130 [Actinidia rufa]